MTKFYVLVNEILFDFFLKLRWGDPYLFILAMEALSRILRKAREGDFILGFSVGRRGGDMEVSHLLFVDDTLIFCNANQE